MKNHWLEKRRTKEQRERILRQIANKGLAAFATTPTKTTDRPYSKMEAQPILWFAPIGLNRGKVPSIQEVYSQKIDNAYKSVLEVE